MLRYIILLSAFIYGGETAFAQADTMFVFNKLVSDSVTDFTVDNLGNLYVVNTVGQIRKIGPTGDSLAAFNNLRQYGNQYFMDVTNPLKVLLYYRNFGTIVVLDRFLSTRSTIDLRKIQLFQVSAIGQSYDNNIWVFDELESTLKRIDEQSRLLGQTTDFRQLVDSTPSPQFIIDQNRLVYLYDSAKGVYMFDYYGAFKNRIQLRGWTDFTVIGNAMFGRDATRLYRYEQGTLNLQSYPIPAAMQDARKIKIMPGSLYVLRNNRLEVYTYR